MSRIGSTPVTKQPSSYGIYNSFSLMGNEKCLHEWTFEEGICGCSTTYHNTLTNARLLIRTETKNCCYKQYHTDVSIFLRDIAEMRQTTEARNNCTFCTCCVRCCRAWKIIELRGTFGSKILHIPKAEMENLQIGISAAIGNHKLISHH